MSLWPELVKAASQVGLGCGLVTRMLSCRCDVDLRACEAAGNGGRSPVVGRPIAGGCGGASLDVGSSTLDNSPVPKVRYCGERGGSKWKAFLVISYLSLQKLGKGLDYPWKVCRNRPPVPNASSA